MDTIYAEGQRRYVESLSAYARQFVGQMQKAEGRAHEGLSARRGHRAETPQAIPPRSTVGTVTEIYDYLRILMSRLGQPHCPACGVPIGSQSADEIIAKIMAQPSGTKLYLMAPLEIRVGGALRNALGRDPSGRLRADSRRWEDLLGRPTARDRSAAATRRRGGDRPRDGSLGRSIADRRDRRERLGARRGVLRAAHPRDDVPETRWKVETHSQHFVCDRCGRSFEPLSPHNFSFNSALGWCSACEGLGTQTGTNPGRVAARSEADARPGRRGALARRRQPAVQVDARRIFAHHRRAGRRAVR